MGLNQLDAFMVNLSVTARLVRQIPLLTNILAPVPKHREHIDKIDEMMNHGHRQASCTVLCSTSRSAMHKIYPRGARCLLASAAAGSHVICFGLCLAFTSSWPSTASSKLFQQTSFRTESCHH